MPAGDRALDKETLKRLRVTWEKPRRKVGKGLREQNLEISGKLSLLQKEPGLGELAPKYSESDRQPFTRMLVRIKKDLGLR